MATALINGGPDYLVELDTGATVDGFELGDAVRGVLDNPDYVLNGTTDFAANGQQTKLRRRARAVLLCANTC